jgi:hypothetical protein
VAIGWVLRRLLLGSPIRTFQFQNFPNRTGYEQDQSRKPDASEWPGTVITQHPNEIQQEKRQKP